MPHIQMSQINDMVPELIELNKTLKHMTRLMELMILEDGPKSWDERKSILEHLNVIREDSK